MGMMYIPKRLKWNSLTEFKQFLERETTEKIAVFEGWRLVTETTEYGIVDGVLKYHEVKRESKSIKGRSNGTATDKERMGTHGRSDHVKPNGKKASKVCSTKVPKKVSKPKKSPK
jgi:hypothetical protein